MLVSKKSSSIFKFGGQDFVIPHHLRKDATKTTMSSELPIYYIHGDNRDRKQTEKSSRQNSFQFVGSGSFLQ
jgi:hypothetical protein